MKIPKVGADEETPLNTTAIWEKQQEVARMEVDKNKAITYMKILSYTSLNFLGLLQGLGKRRRNGLLN